MRRNESAVAARGVNAGTVLSTRNVTVKGGLSVNLMELSLANERLLICDKLTAQFGTNAMPLWKDIVTIHVPETYIEARLRVAGYRAETPAFWRNFLKTEIDSAFLVNSAVMKSINKFIQAHAADTDNQVEKLKVLLSCLDQYYALAEKLEFTDSALFTVLNSERTDSEKSKLISIIQQSLTYKLTNFFNKAVSSDAIYNRFRTPYHSESCFNSIRKSGNILVAVHEGEIVAIADYGSEGNGEVEAAVILNDKDECFRKKGIATELLRFALDLTKAKGCSSFKVIVRLDNCDIKKVMRSLAFDYPGYLDIEYE